MTPHIQVKILLIDEEPEGSAALQAALRSERVEAHWAKSGDDALAQVREADFAAILLNLGERDLETARLIRSCPRAIATPLVFFTTADAEEACAFAPVDFLSKPVAPAILKAKMDFFIESHLSRERLLREKSFLEAVLENIEDGIVACDGDGTLTLFNRATKELHGLPQAPLAPEKWASHYRLFGPDGKSLAKHEVPLFRALAGEVVKDSEMVIAPSKGEARTLLASGQPLYAKDGRKLGAVVSMHDITDRKKATDAMAEVVREQALRRSEERVKAVLESISDGFILLDRDWNIIYMNAAAERINGTRREDMLGKNHWEIYPAAVGTHLHREFLRAAAQGIRINFENYYEPWDRWFELEVAPGPDGETAVYYRDITERKQTDNALRQSEARNRAVIETALDCILGMDLDGCITEFNPAAERTFGYKKEEVMGHELAATIVPPELRDGHRQGMRRYLAGGEKRVLDRRLELQAIRKGGERFDCELTVTRNPGEPASFTGFLRDVTEAKRAAVAIQASEERFRLLAETIPNLAWMARPDGHIFWYNRRWYDYTGTTPEQMEGWGWQEVHHPEELPKVVARWQESIDSGSPFNMVFPLKGADGVFRPFLTLVNPFRDPSGEIVFWFGTNTDITEQKETEDRLARLAASERHRSGLLGQVADASRSINAVLSLDSIIRVLAEEARRIIGARAAVASYIPQGSDGTAGRAVSLGVESAGNRARLHENDSLSGEVSRTNRPVRMRRTSPGEDSCGWIGIPLIGHGGHNLGVLELSDKDTGDFTDEDEAILVQLAATASVGLENARLYGSLREQDQRKDEFIATLAHELRNPLAPLRTGLEILKISGDGDQKARDMMERQLGHMVRLVDDLMDVSRVSRGQMELKPELTTVRTVLQTAIEACSPLMASSKHELSVSLPERPLYILADPTRLSQMLGNLLNNAAKYTPQGGRIEFSAVSDDKDVILRVTDSGVGIPTEMLAKVFDLFIQVGSSLERSQGGLGIGLSLVKRLAEMHGGRVAAESAGPGLGSTFTITLPLAAEGTGEAEVSAAARESPAESRRILVVDDNVDGAESLAMLLQLTGHETRIVHNGPDTLAAALEFGPDLVFLDIGLPGMNGYEVARCLRGNPGTEKAMLVALTGWGSDEDRRRAHEAGFDAHLAKPVDPSAVREIVGRCGPPA